MAEDVVIRAEGLGKKYIIGHETVHERYRTLRDVAARTARDIWKRASDTARGRAIVRGATTEEFWALKDVNFEVKRGEVLGIIGRNGAGKSTLLKILSRITEPTEGSVTIDDRVASLLEVGTGFHPELTGRENIYLNGAILGMSRAKIRRKFDEIVDFSGVEQFIDTPIKRYSSGMHVRLAFSVAAHLEPEILIIDEVLAIGDAEFQKKCLGKMGEIAKHGGRTVLFVSHQLASVGLLCPNAMLLHGGRVTASGTTAKVIAEYVSSIHSNGAKPIVANTTQPVALAAIVTHDADGNARNTFDSDEELQISIKFHVRQTFQALRVGLRITSPEYGTILTTTDADCGAVKQWQPGEHSATCSIPAHLLSPGEYYVSVAADVPMISVLFDEIDVVLLSITPIGAAGSNIPDNRRGIVRPILTWREASADVEFP